MRAFGRQFFTPWKDVKNFDGTWEYRLQGLFDCGVDFTGRSVLDAGCNMGVVAYEIAKRRPASIHGIDHYSHAIRTAQAHLQACGYPQPLQRCRSHQ